MPLKNFIALKFQWMERLESYRTHKDRILYDSEKPSENKSECTPIQKADFKAIRNSIQVRKLQIMQSDTAKHFVFFPWGKMD